ncbi:MAG TPA: ATP synthase F0 subunit C [Phycisphaerae bacterium]|nr:ATP synthase F0 subunit C [Phycisphaerae bacterium]
MRTTGKALLLLAALGVLGDLALAAPDANSPAKKDTAAAATEPVEGPSWSKAVATLGACFGAALAAMAGGYGVSRIGGACIESIARQPEAARDMFAPMVVAAGMVEVGMLFAIVVCLLSLFM